LCQLSGNGPFISLCPAREQKGMGHTPNEHAIAK
jgi:hypothetical protein